jgi:hypothetical protein
MKSLISGGLLLAVVSIAHPALAQDHGSAAVVTGISMSNGSPLTDAVSSFAGGFNDRMNFAGRVTFNVVPGFQALGEVGRLGNVLPPLTSAILSFSPVDVGASAFYYEGGVRALLGHSNVSPYVEATGGFARLNLRIGGFGATADDLIDLGLGFVNRTSPMAGLGGGVMWQAGPMTFDTGYRYKKIFSNDFAATLLTGGDQLTSHQVVFGAGLRF